jgi:hypothetical protein
MLYARPNNAKKSKAPIEYLMGANPKNQSPNLGAIG